MVTTGKAGFQAFLRWLDKTDHDELDDWLERYDTDTMTVADEKWIMGKVKEWRLAHAH